MCGKRKREIPHSRESEQLDVVPWSARTVKLEFIAANGELADGLDHFGLATIVPLSDLFARVTEQFCGSLNTG
jgi:hypothetical protein